jgi:predicted transposase YbfD/YdcC
LKVIELLDLAGRLVTADALHCHHRMAEAVIAKGGDYLLARKGNRRHWLARAGQLLDQTHPAIVEQEEVGHGRNEWRRAEVVATDKPLMAAHRAFIRIVRNILQAADTDKIPISHRIKKCAWNDDYLIHALTHMP